MPDFFQDQVVVITGASAGIGAALAAELDRRGARLVLVARRREPLEGLAAALRDALPVAADVTRREQVDAAMAAALARFGRVDTWINNAGRGINRPLELLTDADLGGMVRDNLSSALYGMQAVLPHLKARGAAKAALNSLTETLRLDLARSHPGLKVHLVLPGIVATDFGLNALGGGPDSRALPGAQDVEEVARVVADGLAAGRADISTRPQGLDMVLGHLKGLAGA